MCRVSARAELSLRQRLSQREDRISELKDTLAAARGHHSANWSALQPAHSLSPRSHSPAEDDHYQHTRHSVHQQSTSQLSRGRPQHRRVLEQGQHRHHALSPGAADTEAATVTRSEAQQDVMETLPQFSVDVHHSKQQQGAEAQRHPARLPYFQSKSQVSAQLAGEDSQPSAAPQQAATQHTTLAPAQPASHPISSTCSP